MTTKFFLRTIAPLIILSLWVMVSQMKLVNPLLLPSPADVFEITREMLFTGNIFPDILASLYRLTVCLSAAIIFGIPLGLLIGYFEKAYLALEFPIEFLRSVPSAALASLFIILFGIGDKSVIALGFLASFLVIIVNTSYGVFHGNKLRRKVAKSMGATGVKFFVKIIFPESLPYIFVGIRIAISIALVIVIFTEMLLGAQGGIGNRLIHAQLVFNTKELYALIILIGTIGYLINKIFLSFEKRVVHWAGK